MKQQRISHRKYTGAKLHRYRRFRKREMGRDPSETQIGEYHMNAIRVHGGQYKQKTLRVNFVNTYIPKENKVKKLEIKRFLQNGASVDYQRRSILTRGAIVETELGKVKITSRPGQIASLSGVLIE
jgi:small subunit ribosomal protein S8e